MSAYTPLCVAPWESIYIAENRHRPCCRIISGTYANPPENVAGLMEIVNSPYLRQLRRRLRDHDIKNTVCDNCIRSGLNQTRMYDYSHVTDPVLAERIRAAEDAVRSGAEILDQPPLYLVFSFPGVCNIRCKMCTVHGDYRRGKPRRGNVFLEPAKDLLRALAPAGPVMLSAGGGEPLFNETTLDFMEFAAGIIPPQAVLSTSTNGKLLHKRMDLLNRFDYLDINVSVDGYGPAFESVRIGVTWDRILSNMRLLSSEAARRPGWRVTTRTVLMHSTIPSIPKLVELFLELGFIPEFIPIFGEFYDENVYMFPGLLKGMDWEHPFVEGADLARRAGNQDLAEHLELRCRELRLQATKGVNTYYRAFPLQMDDLSDWMAARYRDTQVVLLGLTEDIGNFLYYYQANKPNFTIAGVALLEDVPPEVDSVLGIRLLTTEELAAFPGRVLISCYTRDYERYKAHARKHLDPSRVDSLSFDVVHAKVDQALSAVGKRPVVLYGVGGCAGMLLDNTPLDQAKVAAFSDSDKAKWGTRFQNRPVIPPQDIPSVARDVIICSRAYEYDIIEALRRMHGQNLAIHALYGSPADCTDSGIKTRDR